MPHLDPPQLPARSETENDPSGSRGFRLLFVCTGNICRSPSAELLLRERLRRGLGSGAEGFEVLSAGAGASRERDIDPTVRQLLTGRGVSEQGTFRSRPLEPALLDGAHLILTAAKAHRLAIGADHPTAYRRCFTMREAVLLLQSSAPFLTNINPVGRAHSLVALLQQVRGTRLPPEDQLDIADPYRQRTAAYRRMIEQVGEVVDVLGNLLRPASLRLRQTLADDYRATAPVVAPGKGAPSFVERRWELRHALALISPGVGQAAQSTATEIAAQISRIRAS